MNRINVVTALALLGLLVRAAGAETLREQSQQSVEARGVALVRVENPRGLVQVRPSADGRIHLTALKIARSSDRAKAVEFARDTRVETRTEAGRYVVVVRYPQRQVVRVNFWDLFRDHYQFPEIEVRLALEVPASLPVSLKTTSGDLETTDLVGPQQLASVSGDLSVRGGAGLVEGTSTSGDLVAENVGRLRYRSVSGDAEVAGARGPLELRSTSGRVKVARAADSVLVGTVSGDVHVEESPRVLVVTSTSGDVEIAGLASGDVRIRSASGDVRLGLAPGVRRAEIATGSGDIVARVPERLACDLDLRTSSGSLDVSLPIQVRTVSRHQVSGSVRGGGVPITLRSSSGDIDVTSGGR